MLQTQVKFLNVDVNTALVCAQLSAMGCSCSCASCKNCVDCVDCPGLTIDDIVMKVYRAGVAYVCGGAVSAATQYPNCNGPYPPCPTPYSPNAGPAPTYFVQYNAYSLTANTVCFYIDDLLTGTCQGQYVGDVFVSGNKSGSITMNVHNSGYVFAPYTVSTGGGIGNDLQP
jgi:hypothetical protein